ACSSRGWPTRSAPGSMGSANPLPRWLAQRRPESWSRNRASRWKEGRDEAVSHPVRGFPAGRGAGPPVLGVPGAGSGRGRGAVRPLPRNLRALRAAPGVVAAGAARRGGAAAVADARPADLDARDRTGRARPGGGGGGQLAVDVAAGQLGPLAL